MGTLILIGRADADWIWDYECECGLQYRVAAASGGVRFWPATGAGRFSRRALSGGDGCVSCARRLTLEGAQVTDSEARLGFGA